MLSLFKFLPKEKRVFESRNRSFSDFKYYFESQKFEQTKHKSYSKSAKIDAFEQ